MTAADTALLAMQAIPKIPSTPRLSLPRLAWVMAAHAAAAGALLALTPRSSEAELPTISVRLASPAAEKPAETPAQPKQRPQPVPSTEPMSAAKPLPVLTAASSEVAPTVAPQPPVQPSQPISAPPQASVAAAPVANAAPARETVAPPVKQDADYRNNPKPNYPGLSKKLGEQGTVLLRVFVETNGRVGKIEIGRSSGFERLDRAALDGVREWTFVPARLGQKAMADWVQVPVVFSLHP